MEKGRREYESHCGEDGLHSESARIDELVPGDSKINDQEGHKEGGKSEEASEQSADRISCDSHTRMGDVINDKAGEKQYCDYPQNEGKELMKKS